MKSIQKNLIKIIINLLTTNDYFDRGAIVVSSNCRPDSDCEGDVWEEEWWWKRKEEGQFLWIRQEVWNSCTGGSRDLATEPVASEEDLFKRLSELPDDAEVRLSPAGSHIGSLGVWGWTK